MSLSKRYIGKYIRLAKHVAQDDNPCYSRQVGAVIVNPQANKVVGIGFNGPPRGTPHTDTQAYLNSFVWPQLTESEKAVTGCRSGLEFAVQNADCKQCPRRLVGAKSGERTSLCTCVHAETNSIVNAAQDVRGCWMFCWCGIPCIECAKLIINSGIERVYCLSDEPDYSWGSLKLLEQANVAVYRVDRDSFNCNQQMPVVNESERDKNSDDQV
jgi:deoxycytidylate deaminase